MSKISIRWGWFIGIVICGSSIGSTNCAFAQITPDGTLPDNSSVKLEGNNSIIEGGTQVGGNLFHSFREFSVPTNGAALFNNAVDIQNIISRVTGGSVSNIDGLIGAKGTANLFLINPNGIVFTKNAQLKVGGSFVASTANALQFGNQGFFSAREKNIPSPLLTINPSALVFNQINQNAAIQNNSVAPAGKDPKGNFDVSGLQVPEGKSLLLVGGNVSMDGGKLNAINGRVELGGLGEPGVVALGVDSDNLSLKFPDNVARTSVSLTNGSRVLVTGTRGGNIAVNASNLEILGRSILSNGIEENLETPETVAGDITLNATGEIKVAGGSIVRNLVGSGSLGNAGNITIDSGSLLLQDGAQLTASTRGRGNAGNVTVRVLDTVSLANANIDSTVQSGGVGKSGNIDIKAATLSLKDGAQLSTSVHNEFLTQPAGQGDAGNVNVKVTGAVNIAGVKNNNSASGIRTLAEAGTGKGGNITIDSGSLSLQDGARLTAETRGQGDAGNVNVKVTGAVNIAGVNNESASEIRTSAEAGTGNGGNITIDSGSLSLQDGARLTAETRGQGDAGNVNVKVTGAVNIAGVNNKFASGIRALAEAGTGNGGNITIDSGSLSLQDGARLTAETRGQGNAGAIKVNAADSLTISGKSANSNSGLFVDSRSRTGTVGDIIVTSPKVTLDNGGRLNAQSQSGNGGNISIQTDLLLLRRGGSISTSAGTKKAGGNGGNITINAPSGFIIAVPSENSDITTKAYTGNGGRVDIRAIGIYGIQPRSNPTSLSSDITASSEFGVNGTVELNTPDIGPNSGLVNLPTIVADTEVAQTCQAGGNLAKSSFTITGRGGLPPNPGEALNTDAVKVDLVSLNPNGDKRDRPFVPSKTTTPAPEPIIEAIGLTLNEKGEVVLTANLPTSTPHTPWLKPASCKGS